MSNRGTSLVPARMRPGDLARVASVGIRTRRLRAALSALGISIGVAAIVAVLGLSSSSQAGLISEINQLGTNLLTVAPGQSFSGATVPLSLDAAGMIGRIHSVYRVAYTATINGENAYKSRLIPLINTNGLSVMATSLSLPATVGTSLAQGSFLNAATATEPVCVLGAEAAQLLGVDHIYPGERIWVAGMWFYLAGILKHAVLASEIDTSVLIGFTAAARYLGYTSVYRRHRAPATPTEIYLRADTDQVGDVYRLLAATADPENPSAVSISQPSDVLVARADAQGAFNGLFLGLGAVALLVGAIGVANIMIISVLERRSEIGLRRALGATRGQIRVQFLAEAILLSLLGGVVGIASGALATLIYARTKHWATVIPVVAWAGGAAAAITIGAVAGLLPAIRAARLSPTEALRTT